MTRPKPLSVTRLPLEAQNLIINHIVGGDDDDQIRRALHDAGHTVDLTRPTLRHYRRLPEVLKQIDGMADEAVQSGFGPTVRRVKLVKMLIGRAWDAILAGHVIKTSRENEAGDSVEEEAQVSVSALELVRYTSVIFTGLMQLEKLLDGPEGVHRAFVSSLLSDDKVGETTAKTYIEDMTPTQIKALFNDMLESALQSRGVNLDDERPDAVTEPLERALNWGEAEEG